MPRAPSSRTPAASSSSDPGGRAWPAWGHLDAHALRIEALSDADRETEIRAGYIEGAEEAQPSVVAFNTFVAGAGVGELVRLVTAFAGTATPPLRLAFSFTEGTVRRNTVSPNPRCAICGRVAASDEDKAA